MDFKYVLLFTVYLHVLVLLQNECVGALNEIHVKGFNQGMVAYTKYIAPKDMSQQFFDFFDRTEGSNDIFLHVNPRYDEMVLVLNSRLNGEWREEDEQRISNFPITPGNNTTITVYANQSAFDIYANGGAFHHHYPFYPGTNNNQITLLRQLGTGMVEFAVGKVLNSFGIGRVVYIHGQAPTTGAFTFDFLPTTPQNFNSDDVHFRIEVELDETSPKVVSSSHMTSRCGPNKPEILESDDGVIPFTPGEEFIVTVFMQQYGFEVAVNGTHFTTYRYREPLAEDMMVMVSGVPYIHKIEYY